MKAPMRYYLLDLSEAEINLIATALGARPWVEVAPLMDKIKASISDQEARSKAAPADGTDTTVSTMGLGGPGPVRKPV